MRFWDSSAIVPLVRAEEGTPTMQQLYASDTNIAVWFFSGTEVLSALCRLQRKGELSNDAFLTAKQRLRLLASAWTEVQDYNRVRQRAERLLEVHTLTAADAFQLAAALVLVEEKTLGFGFVSLDDKLVGAAVKEGFTLP